MHFAVLPGLLLPRGSSQHGCLSAFKTYVRRQSVAPGSVRVPRRTGPDASRGVFDDLSGVASRDENHCGPIFAPLNAEDEGGLGGTSEHVFGPLAVLLVGFSTYEVDQFRKSMLDMEADMVKVLVCTEQAMSMTLEEALNAPAQPSKQLISSVGRAIVLSGMSAAEVHEVIAAYTESGLPETMWAAAVPANYTRTTKAVLEDIFEDHNLTVVMRQSTAKSSSLR